MEFFGDCDEVAEVAQFQFSASRISLALPHVSTMCALRWQTYNVTLSYLLPPTDAQQDKRPRHGVCCHTHQKAAAHFFGGNRQYPPIMLKNLGTRRSQHVLVKTDFQNRSVFNDNFFRKGKALPKFQRKI